MRCSCPRTTIGCSWWCWCCRAGSRWPSAHTSRGRSRSTLPGSARSPSASPPETSPLAPVSVGTTRSDAPRGPSTRWLSRSTKLRPTATGRERPPIVVHQHRPRPAHTPCGDARRSRESARWSRARSGSLLRDPRRPARQRRGVARPARRIRTHRVRREQPRAHNGVDRRVGPRSSRGPLARCPSHGCRRAAESDGPAVVVASTTDMSRVLRNLLENAIRHSPSGTVGQRRGSHRAEIEVAVHDQGAGFPDDFREHAFEPFTRADPARNTRTGHSGLGLAIARALVEAHGGRIWLGHRCCRRRRAFLDSSKGASMTESSSLRRPKRRPPRSKPRRTPRLFGARWPALSPAPSPSPSACSSPASSMSSHPSTLSAASSSIASRRG